VEVHEVEPPTPPPALLPQEDDALFSLFQEGEAFPYLDDLLDGDRGDPCFTLEPGMWRTVKRHQQRFGCFAFRDYAADSGWTLRFGSGDFGRGPADGAVVRVRYRTDPGPLANIPSDSLALTPPPGQLATPGLATLVTAVTNPLPFSNALPEESAASIRTAAPEAFRALPRRAVRPEDYGAILGRLAFVQRAHAVTHWTGSWSTDFVAVDPLRSVALTAAQRHWVDRELNSIRLASRDVRRLEAEYLDIDIDISLCVAPDAYAGEVFQAVSTALAAPGFFAPDNFTFGTPLVRSSLVAAAQAVAGVRYVDQVRIRVHGMGDWRDFSEAQLMPAAHQIVRLQNDPDRAAMGILRVHSDRSAVAGS
jgi:predicted phage baseplate assembly protein